MLHLTNGDCAVPPLRAADVEGEILPRREMLHDGPVPNLDPDALRAVRAEFLGDGVQLLEPLANGARTREQAFHAAIAAEERPFLGDGSAWAVLDRLAPLLDAQNVNERGLAVLAGTEEWEPDEERWLGGIRIPAGRSPWRWDPGAGDGTGLGSPPWTTKRCAPGWRRRSRTTATSGSSWSR